MVPTLAAVITPAGDGSSHGKTFSLLLPAGLGARSEMLLELSGSLEGGETVACCFFAHLAGNVAPPLTLHCSGGFHHFIHLKRSLKSFRQRCRLTRAI